MKTLKISLIILMIIIISNNVTLSADITSIGSGNWSSGSVWSGGLVPAANDNVTITAGNTVTIDLQNAVCTNLTIEGGNATLRFRSDGDSAQITIFGNIQVLSGGRFICLTRSPAGPPNSFVSHRVIVYGNFTNNGTVDLRVGSNSAGTATGCEVTFTGSSNSTISLSQTSYSNAVEEFNAIVINKTGNAKVILAAGNLFMSNNTSVGPCVLYLQNGIIETGSNMWVHLATSATAVVNASDASYVKGILGRGMSTQTGTTREFNVGDINGHRPIRIRSKTAVLSGGFIAINVVHGDANTGSSTLSGGIDKVSAVRYYQITYNRGITTTETVNLDRFIPSYSIDDGVTAGNLNLRVAYSTNNRSTWNGLGPVDHLTDLTSPPTFIESDSLLTPYTLSNLSSMFVALARATGTDDNPLPVKDYNVLSDEFLLHQNYPNPFNPSTEIKFQIAKTGYVSVKIFDVLGKEVATLVSRELEPGTYSATWEASGFGGGIYFYKLQTANFVETRKMILVK